MPSRSLTRKPPLPPTAPQSSTGNTHPAAGFSCKGSICTWDQDGTDPKIRIFIISAAFLTLLPLAALAVAAANSLFHGLRPIDGLRPRAAKPIST